MLINMERTKSIFVETFGDSPHIRTLDFFLTFSEFDYSKSLMASELGISRVTMEPIWNRLIKSGFLKKIRVIGRAEMYSLNKSNPRVKELLDLNFKFCSSAADEEIEEGKIVARANVRGKAAR